MQLLGDGIGVSWVTPSVVKKRYEFLEYESEGESTDNI
jgi:hypothetical protein